MTTARDKEFACYVERYSRALYNEARNSLTDGNHHDAEEIVQAALVATWESWDEISDAKAPHAYVRTIMRNTWATWHRRKRVKLRFTDELPEESYEDAEPEERDLYEVLGEAVGRLAPRQREVVKLRYHEALTEAQTARKLGVSLGTVKTTNFRALATLRADSELRQAWLDARLL